MERANIKTVQNMNAKQNRSSAVSPKFDSKKLVSFVGEIKQEFRKVEWTSKSELLSYTKIVLISIFLFGLLVYLVDLAIQGILGGFNLLIRFIGG
jgi:preprotein translocase subunit SecE